MNMKWYTFLFQLRESFLSLIALRQNQTCSPSFPQLCIISKYLETACSYNITIIILQFYHSSHEHSMAAVLFGGKNVFKLHVHYFKKIIWIYASNNFLCKTSNVLLPTLICKYQSRTTLFRLFVFWLGFLSLKLYIIISTP